MQSDGVAEMNVTLFAHVEPCRNQTTLNRRYCLSIDTALLLQQRSTWKSIVLMFDQQIQANAEFEREKEVYVRA